MKTVHGHNRPDGSQCNWLVESICKCGWIKPEGMTRVQANKIVQSEFGPRAEAVRVSSPEKSSRFVVCNGVESNTKRPLVLGAGRDFSSAILAANESQAGREAREEHRKSIELAASALASKTPLEFADKVMASAIEEAKANGWTEDQIAVLKQKFESARSKISEGNNDNDDKQSAGTEENHDHSNPGNDHPRAGTQDQQDG